MDQQKQPFNPLLAVLAALAALFFVFPLIGMITGAPWGNVFGIITSKSSLDALGLSIIASLASTVIALMFGFPLAWLLARNTFRGKAVVRGLTTLPMVLPPVVGGIALLLAYGRRGFIGQPLDRAFGISLPFTLAGVIVAESFVAMPFFVITVESGLRSMNRRLEDAARSLGARRLTVFRRVTLPLIWPSLAAGTVLTWARALGEFGATITFAGNLPGRTQTMPLAIYVSQSSGQMAEAIALSLVLVVVSPVVMVFRRRLRRRGLTAMLKADIQLRLSRLDLDAAFTVESGEVVALLGPNGSGKSTTLRALMGLLPLAGGQVVLDGTVLEDPAQHIKVPPENRRHARTPRPANSSWKAGPARRPARAAPGSGPAGSATPSTSTCRCWPSSTGPWPTGPHRTCPGGSRTTRPTASPAPPSTRSCWRSPTSTRSCGRGPAPACGAPPSSPPTRAAGGRSTGPGTR